MKIKNLYLLAICIAGAVIVQLIQSLVSAKSTDKNFKIGHAPFVASMYRPVQIITRATIRTNATTSDRLEGTWCGSGTALLIADTPIWVITTADVFFTNDIYYVILLGDEADTKLWSIDHIETVTASPRIVKAKIAPPSQAPSAIGAIDTKALPIFNSELKCGTVMNSISVRSLVSGERFKITRCLRDPRVTNELHLVIDYPARNSEIGTGFSGPNETLYILAGVAVSTEGAEKILGLTNHGGRYSTLLAFSLKWPD